MLTLALWGALTLAILATVAAITKASLEADEENSHLAESVGFFRMTVTGIFGVVIGQALSPLPISWWVQSLIAVTLMALLLLGSQVLSSRLGHRHLGSWLKRVTSPFVRSINLLFTPLSLPKSEEPEDFEKELLDSVEEFGETIVREIMVPRVDMATISADANLTEAMTVFLARGYSRLPVVGKKIDDVRGVLYIKDVAKLLHEQPQQMNSTRAGDVARAAEFIPESKPVDDLLRDMQLNSTHIAIIVDEYGGVAGLATMEDVIEEIVGEISDEYDRDAPDISEQPDGSYLLTARFSLFDLGELFELELEDEDVDTIGGLLTKQLGHLPARGEQATVSGLVLVAEAVEARRKRLITVRVSKDSNLTDALSAFEPEGK